MTTSPQLGMRAAKDEDQLAYALRENRVLITHDQDFLVLNSKGVEHAGIVHCQMRRRGIGQLMRKIEKLAADEADLHNRVVYL